MVRSSSTSSCFKLINCAGGGNESVDRDDLEAPESKGSSERSRWSFRKRSARHRVLSNSVASEATSGNKARADSTITNFATQGSSTIPEKNSDTQWAEEKSQLQIPVASKLMEKTENVDADENVTADEGSVIIIQAVIRRFLAERILLKHKNIIKLQAAVRGHIVRRHAVGTLRCVQAIVKMQNLVRERHARLLLQGSSIKEKGKENMDTKPGVTYISIQKLLSNGFARQLIESTPKTKTINIKCDPSKSDSAWIWLERWMSVSSTETEQLHGYESTAEQQQPNENTEEVDNQLETMIPVPENCQLRDDTTIEALPESLEADENVITYDVDNYNFQECRPAVSSVGSSMDESCPQNVGEENSSVGALDSLAGHAKESDVVSKLEPDFFNGHPGTENKHNIPILENPGVEGSEIDAKKPAIGSKKASNPAFVAAQAKFEELSSAANLVRSGSLSNNDVTVGLEADLPVIYHVSKTSEIEPADSSLSLTVGSQVNGSECGTELSISSTLDSPDRSEAGIVYSVLEMKSLEDAVDNPKNEVNLDVEEKIGSKILESDLYHSNPAVRERDKSNITVNNEHLSSTITGDSLDTELKPAITATIGVQMEQKIETSHPVGKSSPEAAPKSHVTVPESLGTPSSQVTVKPKKIRSVKNGSRVSTGKESPLELNEDYGARNTSERLPREHRNGKRRDSFSSARTDQNDQELRDSSSTNSLPSYMQATESARAKVLSHNSPKSSPDMQDRDLYIRKRHSLPGATDRQGSPRVQRVQQGSKGNGTQSPQERKWRR